MIKNVQTTVLLLLFTLIPTLTQAAESYLMKEVTSGIYYHQGIHEDASKQNIGAIANVGFIIGNDCVAIIDSGGSYKEGELLLKAVREITSKPICYVINTHVHPDHLLGNAAFKLENPVYIGHKKLPDAIAARKEFFERVFSETLGDAYDGAEFISPDKTVTPSEPITLDLGQREILLTAYTTAHTDHDLTIFDMNTETLWTGDLLFIERIPSIDGSLNGWINVSKKLSESAYQFLIPGHGPAVTQDEIQNAWKNQLTYFTLIRGEIRSIINDFGTIEQATKTVGLSESDRWLLFDDYHRRNITASFVELEWE